MDNDPHRPSAYTIERSVAAWHRAKLALINDPEFTDDEAALATALAADPAALPPEVLLARLIEALAFGTARVDEAERFMAQMRARRERYAARVLAIRTEIFEIMQATERRSLSTPFGTATVARGRASVVITDPELIPDEYVRIETKRTPKLAAILADLDEGVIIPGAVKANPAPILRVSHSGAHRSDQDHPPTDD